MHLANRLLPQQQIHHYKNLTTTPKNWCHQSSKSRPEELWKFGLHKIINLPPSGTTSGEVWSTLQACQRCSIRGRCLGCGCLAWRSFVQVDLFGNDSTIHNNSSAFGSSSICCGYRGLAWMHSLEILKWESTTKLHKMRSLLQASDQQRWLHQGWLGKHPSCSCTFGKKNNSDWQKLTSVQHRLQIWVDPNLSV